MGSMQAMELASGDYNLGLEDQIRIHLTSNHYPPVPVSMVPVCMEAIDMVNTGLPWGKVKLPEGVTFRGLPEAPAYDIVEQHHLEFWLAEEEY
jgi:hypothetical protein